MKGNLKKAIDQQMAYLENHKSPEGLEGMHMHFLKVLLDARRGNIEPLFEIKSDIESLRKIYCNPELETRTSIRKKKLALAAKDDKYLPATQDSTLQNTLDAAMDAVMQPQLDIVIYMINIFGPVVVHLADTD